MIDNPYYHRGPINEPRHFYGRAKELRTAFNFLKNGQSVSIVGIRRIGKTSLLLQLANPDVAQKYGLDLQRRLFVYLDCNELTSQNRAGAYRRLLQAVQERLAERGQNMELGPAEIDQVTFAEHIRTLKRQGWQVIFLLDEFEQLGNNEHLDLDFFGMLRSQIVPPKGVVYVTASGRPLKEITYKGRADTSPFFNVFHSMHLGGFTQTDAHQLISEPATQAGFPFASKTVDRLYSLSGGHPLAIQIACFHAFELNQEKGILDQADYTLLTEQTLTDMEAHLQLYWDNLTGTERALLKDLVTGDLPPKDDKTSQRTLRALRNKGLLRQAGRTYRPFGKILTHFLHQRLEQRRTAETTTGKVVLNRYEILERLGSGGMAEVYRGRHIPLNQPVAIKLIKPELSRDPEFRERFKREARIAYTLHHQHIVRSLDFGEENGTYYIVMDLVEGDTLAAHLQALRQAGQQMPLTEAIQITTQIGQALDYAHRQDITHRDITPTNIILTPPLVEKAEERQAILTDFGIARMVGITTQTRTGMGLGTPLYAAPEQLEAGHTVDHRADIYALGMILYEMATRRLPYKEWYHAVTSPVPPPSNFRDDLSPTFEAAILKALAKEPDRRYQTVGEMITALDRSGEQQ